MDKLTWDALKAFLLPRWPAYCSSAEIAEHFADKRKAPAAKVLASLMVEAGELEAKGTGDHFRANRGSEENCIQELSECALTLAPFAPDSFWKKPKGRAMQGILETHGLMPAAKRTKEHFGEGAPPRGRPGGPRPRGKDTMLYQTLVFMHKVGGTADVLQIQKGMAKAGHTYDVVRVQKNMSNLTQRKLAKRISDTYPSKYKMLPEGKKYMESIQ